MLPLLLTHLIGCWSSAHWRFLSIENKKNDLNINLNENWACRYKIECGTTMCQQWRSLIVHGESHVWQMSNVIEVSIWLHLFLNRILICIELVFDSNSMSSSVHPSKPVIRTGIRTSLDDRFLFLIVVRRRPRRKRAFEIPLFFAKSGFILQSLKCLESNEYGILI